MKISIFLSLLVSFGISIMFGQTIGDYRTARSGSWDNPYTWEYYYGNYWGDSYSTPNSGAGVITIRTGHLVTISSSLTIDQTVVEEGATLTLNSGILTINEGDGIDLLVRGIFNIFSNITGTGTIEIDNQCNWFSSYISSELIINESGTLSLTGSSSKTLRGSLYNYGSVNWTNGTF